MARLSIALATFNGAEFLQEQLDSFAAQTRLPDELVVCDDCSSDSTIEILEQYARLAPFEVRVIRNERNLGFLKNFSKAASLCEGDIVFFSDQDDVWHPEKLEQIEKAFHRNPSVMVVLNDARLVDRELRASGRTQYGNVQAAGVRDDHFNTGCCSAHRRIWQSLTLPVPEWVGYHDVWINMFAYESGCALILPIVLQDYRRHGSNVTNWILSNPKGASPLQLFRVHGLQDARDGWRLIAKILDAMADRARDAITKGSPLPTALMKRALLRIESKRDALLERAIVCSMSRPRRPLSVFRMLMSGRYNYFHGWKSALKDLIRP